MSKKRRAGHLAEDDHEPPRKRPRIVLSLSDDDDDEEKSASNNGYKALLTGLQQHQINMQGYCSIPADDTDNALLMHAVTGWIRENHRGGGIIAEIINAIVYFHGAVDIEEYVQIESDGKHETPQCFLASRVNVSLCRLFNGAELRISLKDVRAEALKNVLCWLGHHKGVAPPPLPCPVRSVHMHRIVSDPWDATSTCCGRRQYLS